MKKAPSNSSYEEKDLEYVYLIFNLVINDLVDFVILAPSLTGGRGWVSLFSLQMHLFHYLTIEEVDDAVGIACIMA